MADFDVGAKVDKQSFDKALDVFKKLKKEQQSFVKEQTKAGASSKAIVKSIETSNKELREQAKILDVLDDKWRQNVDGVGALEAELKRLNDAFAETSQKVGAFGDIQSNLGAGGALLGAAGLGGAERGLTLGGEGVALLEELPRLKDAFKAAGPALQVTTQALGLTNLASTGASLGLGATAASLFAIAVPVALVAAAVGSVIFVFKQFTAAAAEQTKVLATQLDAQRAVSEAIGEGLTSDEAQSRIEEIQRQRESEIGLLGNLENAYQSMENQLGPLSGVVKVFSSQEQELADTIDEARANVAGLDAEMRQLESALANESFATNDAAIAEAELTDARQTAVEEADRLAATIGQFESKRADLIESNMIKEANALEIATLNQEFADEDQLAQEQEHQTNLLDIASEGQRKIEAISSELSALPAERLTELSEVESEGNKELSQVRQSFFEKSSTSLEKFQRDSARIETETAKKRIRLLEDVQDQLDDAARANDVIAFLRIQRESEKQIERGIIDEEAAEQQRIQRFIDGQQKERAAFEAKEADILLGIQEERQAVNESFSERREQLLETLALERKALDERTQSEIARFDSQEAREEQAAERSKRRADIIESQQDAAAQRQAQRASLEQNEAEQAHARELAKIAEIDRAIQSIQPPPAATSSGGGTTSTRRGGGGSFLGAFSQAGSRFGQRSANTGSSGSITPFHNGGEVTFPNGETEGLILAKAGEQVIDPDSVGSPKPFSNTLSGQNRGGGTGGMTFAPTIQISSTVGDIASRADVDRANEGLAMEISTQFVKFWETATTA